MVGKNQKYRSAKTSEGIVIFPFPPIKGKKWLIKIRQEENLTLILGALNRGELISPLENSEPYESGGIHSDGQTPLYLLKNENLHS